MNYSEKDFLKQFKLFFSSLFARAMTKVVVGCPGLKNNEFIFSNIGLDKIQMYEPDPKYFIHKVELLDQKFLEDLIEVFPFIKDSVCLIYTDKLLSTIGKHSGSLKNIKITTSDQVINITVNTDNNDTLEVPCAELISEFTASEYKRIFDQALVDESNVIERSITDDLDLAADYSIIDIKDLMNQLYCFVHPTKGYVSIKEYPTKAVLFDYTYDARITNDKASVKINTRFRSPMVNVTSVQPFMIWFKKLNKEETTNE